jgi:hypothetical protein
MTLFARNDEKWRASRVRSIFMSPGEAESLNFWWQDPADETDQLTLPESGIVFAGIRSRMAAKRVTES